MKNDPIVQQRSRENKIHIVFVHPAEFPVTEPDSAILSQTVLADRLPEWHREGGWQPATPRPGGWAAGACILHAQTPIGSAIRTHRGK